jgi:RNA polymerase sigma factor (sigma-70 family)
VKIGSAADSLTSAAEANVVALACTGDHSAFAELVRRRQSSLRNLLRRLCRDVALADDLAQETFLQAWKQLRHLRSVGAFGGWLRQIAVNAWLQHARSSEWFTDFDNFSGEPATPSAYADRLDLDAALSRLPPQVRACIVLAYHEGMSHGEIASTTHLPLGTVKSHISRGTARLREVLAAYDDQSEQPTCAMNS